MVAIGCVYLYRPTNELEAEQRDLAALWLCAAGLIATFLTGYVGYIVINAIWPSFYYTPIKAGTNIWLIAQGLSTLLYLSASCLHTCLSDMLLSFGSSAHTRPRDRLTMMSANGT